MALKGEGDPRWIVEEREDGKNLNAWHWEERNLLPWIKSRLPHFLVSECHRGADEKDVLSIVKIGTVKGEASSQQRKGRRFCLYELEIKMDWELRRTPEADVVKGEVHLPYVADENDKDEFEIQITTSSGPDQSKARDFAKPVLTKHLRKQMVAFLTEMLGEHTSATEMKQLQQDQAAAALAAKEKLESQQRVASELSSGGETVHMEIKFPGVPPALIYETLLDVNRLRAFTQSEVSLERKVGSKFSLFSGNITGVIDQMEENRMLEQRWRFKSWPEGHYSKVRFTFDFVDGDTTVILHQTGVPRSEVDQTRDGWQRNFFERWRAVFGFNCSFM